jgi:PAS domain S-box-containing protein
VDNRTKTKAQLIAELEALQAEVAVLKQAGAVKKCDSTLRSCLPQQELLLLNFFNGATHSNVGLFIVDTKLRYLQINQALANINGYSIESHLGQSIPDLLPDLASTVAPLLQSLIQTGQPISNLEVSGFVPSQPGVLRHWLSSYFPIASETGAVVAVGGIVQEISEYKQTIEALRQSEASLRLAQRLAHVGSWQWDCVTDTVTWSEEMYRIHGRDLSSPAPQSGEFAHHIYPDDLSVYQQLIDRARAGYSFEVDLRIIRPDGEIRYIEARGEPGVFNQQGELLRLFGTVLDVTDRKRAEEALRQSEFALREAQRLSHVGSWHWSLETGIVWSEEIYRIHGLDPSSSPPDGQEMAKYVHPDDLEIHSAIAAASVTGQAYEFDLRIIRPDGEIRYIEVRGEPGIRNEQGEIIGLFGTVLDVTDRKRVEEQLRRSEANLARAQKIAHIGSWEYDIAGQSCTWSEELYRIHQLDPSQSAPVGEAMDRLIHPDDLWIDRQLVKQPLVAGQPCEVDLRIVRQDGEVRHIEVRGEPIFNSSGQITSWVGTVMDITERKRIEEKLRRNEAEIRAMLSAIPDMLIRVKKDGTRLFISPGSIKSCNPVETLVGGSVYDTLPLELVNQRMAAVKRAIETDERQVYEYEIVIDGEIRYEEARVVAINEEEALIVVRDITERHQLEQIKTEFISVVSHELRTPLTSIQVALSLLDGHLVEPNSDDGQAMIHVAAEGVDRLVRLVNDILDLERLESGKLQIKTQPCNLIDLIYTAIEQMQELANQASIAIKVSANPCSIDADPDRLVQVLTNLLSNAIRFSPANSTIEIGVIAIPSTLYSSPAFRFMVKDEGRGIPADQLDRIFERFQQVDASDSREKSGTGLGLAICRMIIQQHGGQIWAESRLGEGSVFYFTIPVLEMSK